MRLRKRGAGRSIRRSKSPGASTFWCSPVTKSTTGTCRSPPSRDQIVQTPSSAAVSEIIGPAGSDMQMLPPTVAVFQILNEARNARQHWPISGARSSRPASEAASSSAIVQVAAIRRPCSSDLERPASRRLARSISRRRCGCGSENSQVPPASQASPSRQRGDGSRRAAGPPR